MASKSVAYFLVAVTVALPAFMTSVLIGSLRPTRNCWCELDGLSFHREGALQLVKGSEKPEVIPIGDFACSLSHVRQVDACCPGRDPFSHS